MILLDFILLFLKYIQNCGKDYLAYITYTDKVLINRELTNNHRTLFVI